MRLDEEPFTALANQMRQDEGTWRLVRVSG